MRHPLATRTVGRTCVVASWLLALVLAGDPLWPVVLLGAVLVLVWAAPYALATGRHPAQARPSGAEARPAVEQGQGGPAT